MRYEEKKHKEIEYIVRYPNEFVAGEKRPVLINIHGAGGRGGTLDEIKNHAIFAITEQMTDFPFVLVAP